MENSIQLVTYGTHAETKWKTPDNFLFSADDSFCPLSASELHMAVLGLPIAFIPYGDSYLIVSLQGLSSNKNLLVDQNGMWLARYIPSIYRYYPLLLVEQPQSTGDYSLCMQSENASGTSIEGDALFNPDGTPSSQLKQLSKELAEHTKGTQTASRLAKELDSLNLIETWEIEIVGANGKTTLEGVYKVNEKQLYALEADQLIRLRDSGAMTVAYCQLLSMSHLAFLRHRAMQTGESDDVVATELSFDSGESLNFENF